MPSIYSSRLSKTATCSSVPVRVLFVCVSQAFSSAFFLSVLLLLWHFCVIFSRVGQSMPHHVIQIVRLSLHALVKVFFLFHEVRQDVFWWFLDLLQFYSQLNPRLLSSLSSKSLGSSREFFSTSMMFAFCCRNLWIATKAESLLINSLLKTLSRPRYDG